MRCKGGMPALLEAVVVLAVLLAVAVSEEGADRFFPADDRGEPVFWGEPGAAAADEEVTSGAAAGAAIVGAAGAAAVDTTGCDDPVVVVIATEG